MSEPVMRWAAHPDSGHWHAIALSDLKMSEPRGYAEALCGVQLPHGGLEHVLLPGDLTCLPCVIGATADLRVLDWVDTTR
ncbi:MAG: hypothetical protein ACRDQI_00805 [Pseudonocardiaceae bacterium]